MDKTQLKAKREEILRLAERHGAQRLRLFGSVARDDARAASDVDFLVEMAPDRSLLDRVGLMQDLEDLLGCPVDLVSEKTLHGFVRDRILAEAEPL